MILGRVVCRADQRCIATDVALATSMRARLVGLLRHKCLPDGAGLWLQPGGGIHTLGMRFAIDVVFLDTPGKVLRIAAAVAPQRLRFAPRGTHSVLELSAGLAGRTGLRCGQSLEFHCG